MVTYKGWRILAVLHIPRYFAVDNVGVRTHNPLTSVKLGKEIMVKPAYKPSKFAITRFCADKDGQNDIYGHSVASLKKQIDEKEEDHEL